MAEEHPFTNRLIHQKSPYLLQHAHNPVNWYPWGEEAFSLANEENKPIFLSIGYSTCHWCHVMEKESFESPEIAEMLNGTFINIKVDREELPEVDSLYMEFAQSMMTGSAGWPLNIILTPQLKPFFATTYLPPEPNHGLMGLVDLIVKVRDLWHSEEKERVLLQAEKIVEVFSQSVQNKGDVIPSLDDLDDAIETLFKMADPIYGGMKGAPKFPVGYQWSFMLRYSTWQQDSRAYFVVDKTLDMMRRGGIYDHLGGGFSRYSIDEQWLVPHFEKMLYDNALVAHTYLEAWQATKRLLFEETTKETLDYILREMTHPRGGFFAAQDADSEGKEGWFYTWPFEELVKELGEEDAPLFCEYYGASSQGNFEGRNVLNTPLRAKEFCEQKGLEIEDFSERMSEQRVKLFAARSQRKEPGKDDKILTSWNGLMIATMAEAGAAMQENRYLDAAEKAARFIGENLWHKRTLFRRFRDGESNFSGGLEEHSFLIRGLLSLFEVGLGSEWLSWAMELSQILQDRFKGEGGAFYQTDGTDPHLIVRKCQLTDGAEPSGNGVHCENLLRLHQLTGDEGYLEQAKDIFKAVHVQMEQYAPGYCYHLLALDRFYHFDSPTFVISLNHNQQHFEVLRHQIFSQFCPHRSVIWNRQEDSNLRGLTPQIENQPVLKGETTLYICRRGVCQEPLTDLSAMIEAIRKL